MVAAYEALPIQSESVEKVFYYTPHGLEDLDLAINEARRVLRRNGRLLILLYDEKFKESFLFYKLSRLSKGRWKAYFQSMDNGRFEELSIMSKSFGDWTQYFHQRGFIIERKATGLSPTAWKFYDTQTRPILRFLIKIFSNVGNSLRIVLKTIIKILTYPYILFFYLLFQMIFSAGKIIAILRSN